MCYNQNIDQINSDFWDYQEELEKRSQKLKVNTTINKDNTLFDIIEDLENDVFGEVKLEDIINE